MKDKQIPTNDANLDPKGNASKAVELAWNLSFKGNFNEAEQNANKAIKLAEKHNLTSVKVDALIILGINRINQGLNNESKKFFTDALKLAIKEKIYEKYTNCYNSLANYHYFQGFFDVALENYYLALKYLPQSNNKNLKAKILHNIGTTLTNLENYEDALDYFKKALHAQNIPDDSIDMADYYLSIANIYFVLKEYDEAFDNFNKSIDIYKKHNHINAVHAYSDITNALISTNNLNEAIKYAYLTLEFSEKYNNKDMLLSSYLFLLQIYTKKKQFDKCTEYLDKAKKAINNDTKSIKGLQYHDTLSSYYESIENYKDALKHLKSYMKIDNIKQQKQYYAKIAAEKSKLDYELKKVEAEELQKKSEELESINKLIQKQKDDLIELNNSKDAILSIVSHDLNNSIGAIIPLLQLLVMKEPSLKNNKYIEMIEFSTLKTIGLVKDILEANQIEMNDYKLDLMPFDINLILEQYIRVLKINSANKQINIIINYSNKELICLINEEKFLQIVTNITSNAVKFTKPGGSINISTSLCEKNHTKYACLEVKDTGIGIPPDLIPFLFIKFSPARRLGTEGENSTGLGMSIIQRLVELHNGLIEIKSNVNVGTSIKVYFPIYDQ
ncbi:MAG: tetratricopeptide repeat-containing sensor histidine kinase [Candidatus Cloacimonetes bacterium]|nr:tetratricopeptide repeat-containing sensor histidine kinase [Candidatus Cloacimonadota bacterium]